MRRVVTLLVAAVLVGVSVFAQSGTRKPGIHKSAASVRAAVDASKSELGIVAGQSTQVVEAGGGQIVVRRRVAGPNNASVHEDLTEVYQFTAGGGTFVTGGTLPDAKDRTAGIKSGASQKVQAGDFVILPPGTPHWFSQIDGSVTYVETRFPGNVSRPAASASASQGQNEPVMLPEHRYDLPGTLITAAQIEDHKKKMIAAHDDDVPMNMVKAGGTGGRKQVGISVVTRNKGQTNPFYAVHDDVAEVYYVLEGRGRMKLGGRITDWERRPTSAGNGRGSRGTTAVGAKDVTITKGDVLIIPAGTPHKWEMADEFTSYVVVRGDPDGVAPLMELGTATFPPAK